MPTGYQAPQPPPSIWIKPQNYHMPFCHQAAINFPENLVCVVRQFENVRQHKSIDTVRLQWQYLPPAQYTRLVGQAFDGA